MIRVLISVTHLYGLGHLRRAMVIADALAARGARPLLVSGGGEAPFGPGPGVAIARLPGLRAADQHHSHLLDADGRVAGQELIALRAERLAELVRAFRPAVIVSEHAPFGRHKLLPELEALIGAGRSLDPPARLAASLRDIILPSAHPARRAAQAARAATYDLLLVHGDPRVLRLEESLPEAAGLSARLVYTGYVAAAPGPPAPARDIILVSAGGGRSGAALMAAAAGAAREGPVAGLALRLQPGPLAPPALAPALSGLDLLTGDLVPALARARLAVGLAGYNSLAEALACGTPLLLAPDPSEPEQRQRASRLAARGLARILPEEALSARGLRAAIAEALAAPPCGEAPDLAGADRSAAAILALARGEGPRGL